MKHILRILLLCATSVAMASQAVRDSLSQNNAQQTAFNDCPPALWLAHAPQAQHQNCSPAETPTGKTPDNHSYSSNLLNNLPNLKKYQDNRFSENLKTCIAKTKRTYDCSTCSRTFKDRSNFKRHIKIHTDKPYSCATCKKAFAHSYDCNQHGKRCSYTLAPHEAASANQDQEQHLQQSLMTGEKHFACKYCNKSFTFSSNRNRHQKICTETPHTTTLEQQSTALDQPQLTADFPCSHDGCTAKFATQSALTAHEDECLY